MGHIRLDKRGPKPLLIFYVSNGQKEIPKETVELADTQPATILAALTPVLARLREATSSSGVYTDSSTE